MQIVVIGDVGVSDGMIHIGDEAMFEAAVRELRSRGASDIVAVSSQPEETAERYGIRAVARIGFDAVRGGSRVGSEQRLDRVARTARGEVGLLERTDSAHDVIDAIRASDGVLIAGGGNLSSLWPMHVFERATIGLIAAAIGRPLVVSGQTVGPFLDADDSALVRDLLSSARAVGLRERVSHELCLRLGMPGELLAVGADDASFITTEAEATAPRCLVTLANHIGDADRETVDRRLAELLDNIAERTGLDIVFSAHFGSLDPALSRGDSIAHDRVAALMTHPHSVVAPVDSGSSARLARGASLVVTSRYHPAVFAVAAGVATIGIPVDDYTTTKLTGALGTFGQHSLLAVDDLVAGRGPALVAETWAAREAVRSRGTAIAVDRRKDAAAWWDRVARTLAPAGRD